MGQGQNLRETFEGRDDEREGPGEPEQGAAPGPGRRAETRGGRRAQHHRMFAPRRLSPPQGKPAHLQQSLDQRLPDCLGSRCP